MGRQTFQVQWNDQSITACDIDSCTPCQKETLDVVNTGTVDKGQLVDTLENKVHRFISLFVAAAFYFYSTFFTPEEFQGLVDISRHVRDLQVARFIF